MRREGKSSSHFSVAMSFLLLLLSSPVLLPGRSFDEDPSVARPRSVRGVSEIGSKITGRAHSSGLFPSLGSRGGRRREGFLEGKGMEGNPLLDEGSENAPVQIFDGSHFSAFVVDPNAAMNVIFIVEFYYSFEFRFFSRAARRIPKTFMNCRIQVVKVNCETAEEICKDYLGSSSRQRGVSVFFRGNMLFSDKGNMWTGEGDDQQTEEDFIEFVKRTLYVSRSAFDAYKNQLHEREPSSTSSRSPYSSASKHFKLVASGAHKRNSVRRLSFPKQGPFNPPRITHIDREGEVDSHTIKTAKGYSTDLPFMRCPLKAAPSHVRYNKEGKRQASQLSLELAPAVSKSLIYLDGSNYGIQGQKQLTVMKPSRRDKGRVSTLVFVLCVFLGSLVLVGALACVCYKHFTGRNPIVAPLHPTEERGQRETEGGRQIFV